MTQTNIFQRYLIDPLKKILKQGLTPSSLSWSISFGFMIGTVPILGVSALICLLVGQLLKLNHAAMQIALWIAYPIQLILFLPLIRLGEFLFRSEQLPLDPAILFTMIKQDFFGSIQTLWTSIWHASIAWTLIAIPIIFMLQKILYFFIQRYYDRQNGSPYVVS